MKGTTKVIMGATLIMVASLAIVLSLVLVLLAELYCSLLLRRRQIRKPTSNTTISAGDSISQPPPPLDQSAPPSLGSFYAQGVLRAPRSFLFPAVSGDDKLDLEKQNSQFPQAYESQIQQHFTPRVGLCTSDPSQNSWWQKSRALDSISRVGLQSTSPPSPSFIPAASPKPVQKVPLQGTNSSTSENRVLAGLKHHFMCISNPIYDVQAGQPSRVVDTPFETPDTSPSRLETKDSSGDDTRDVSPSSSPSSLPITPPLTPMKKLPVEACSISLRDGRCVGTSGSDSNSNNGDLSSSSSGSPSTSPSW
ncbi:unnamed protein product [Ilex paraguariensis]|uniref:Uncharacterized protein n=1 Tax=Ilex paraguariensis TaxID=185542 RepID=A0ABC8T3W5_9AQUA